MRIISWNIRQGGGPRSTHIIRQLEAWQPDVVGLCEFRDTEPSRTIASALEGMGLCHQQSTVAADDSGADRLLLASRWPIYIRAAVGVLATTGRWIDARIAGPTELGIVLMWVPSRDEECTKYVFHDAVLEALQPLADTATVAIGDTNTGVPKLDDHTDYFNEREGEWFERLFNAGWADVWRRLNPDRREYSWYHSNKTSRFRIDQAFVTAEFTEAVRDVRYEWGEPAIGSFRGPSDHAAMIVDLD